MGNAKALIIRARGVRAGQRLFVTLVESDGTSWSAPVALSAAWQELVVPLSDLRVALGVKLPLGFPERWNYWLTPAKGRGGPGDRPNLAAVEQVQVSLRPEAGHAPPRDGAPDDWVDVASIALDLN